MHGHLRLRRRRWRLAVVPVVDGHGRHPARRRQAQAANVLRHGRAERRRPILLLRGLQQVRRCRLWPSRVACCGGQINALSYPDKECILANDHGCRIQSGLEHGVAGRRLSEDMAERRYNSVNIDCPCERGRCSHFRGTFAGTGAAVHPALTFSVRPKGEDAPWTEVGTVASVADSAPSTSSCRCGRRACSSSSSRRSSLPSRSTPRASAASSRASPSGASASPTTSSASCATSRARARSWAAARSTSPSSGPRRRRRRRPRRRRRRRRACPSRRATRSSSAHTAPQITETSTTSTTTWRRWQCTPTPSTL